MEGQKGEDMADDDFAELTQTSEKFFILDGTLTKIYYSPPSL